MRPLRLTAAPAILLAALSAAMMLPPSAADAETPAAAKPAATPTAGFRETVAPFLNEHCVRCHGPDKQKAELSLHTLAGDLSGERLLWLSVLDQIESGQMPPKKEPQPPAEQTQAVLTWLRTGLNVAAKGKEDVARTPREGNLVPHDLLFGKGPVEPAAGASAARVWRLRPEAYDAFVKDVFRGRLGQLTQPFGLTTEPGFKDYADLYFVDHATTEILVRNAELIVAGQTSYEVVDGKLKWKNDTVKEFKPLFDPPGKEPTEAELRKAIAQQFKLSVAREPTAEETADLLALYERCAKAADGAGAARTMLAAVLLRPEAIYRMELGAAGNKGNVMLAPREAALAVSLALGDRRDQKLFEAAGKGELSTREQVAAHVRRILDDPKADTSRLPRFFREYFGYDLAPEVFKDKPDDLAHRPETLVRDTDRLVAWVLERDRDVLATLLTTTRTFANYGEKEDKKTRTKVPVPAVVLNPHNDRGRAPPEAAYGFGSWPAEQPAELPKAQRAGILTQPSWLVAHSTNFDNDPVRRGRWVRERLLGGYVPQLPIGVVAQVPDERHRTLRDRMAVTRAAECWQCHRKMDDLGLAFEAYDHYGRFRTTETVLDPEATEKNVDKKGKPLGPVHKEVPLVTTGKVADGGDPALDGPVADAVELAHRLAKSERVRQVFVRHAFRYFMGRNETIADAKTLREADRAYVESGGSFKALVVSLLSSESFLYRAPTAVAEAKE